MGKELEGLNYKELQQLEHQLNEGILSVKDRKVPNYFRVICTHIINTFHTFIYHLKLLYVHSSYYILSCV